MNLRIPVAGRNHAHRPVALFSPFGGVEPLKGFQRVEGIAAEIQRLAAEGFFVIVMPNGTPWGAASAVREAMLRLSAGERVAVSGSFKLREAALGRAAAWCRLYAHVPRRKVKRRTMNGTYSRVWSVDTSVAKISLVGAGMKTHPGVAAGMFRALAFSCRCGALFPSC